MTRYAMLVLPSANRVYSRSAVRLVRSELLAVDHLLLTGSIEDVEERELGGVTYLTFRGQGLSDDDVRVIANLSSLFALFELDGELLRPVTVERLDRYDDDLLTILKYVGKTNEQLTKLLLNLTAAAALPVERFLAGGVKVLDPMCGRGTTLNQVLMYGWDAHGIDVDKRDFEAYAAFVQRWLKDKRIKHKATSGRLRVAGQNLGQRLSIELAATKDAYRAGELQHLESTLGDTLDVARMYRRGTFDLIVTDAPYGVQHGAVGTTRSAGPARSLSRSPRELLAAALPGWVEVLRAGGAIGISWNTKVLTRPELERTLADAGLEPLTGEPFDGFAHRVDQAIDRDVIVARKPR